jgi:hypothetical protein
MPLKTFLPAALLLGVTAALPAHQARSLFATEGRPLTAGRIFAIASDDLDGDRRPDVVVSDFLNHARVLYNDASQSFTRVLTLTATEETATEGHGVAIADFNGDRRLDLFLVYNGNPSRVLFGDGKGGFADSGRAIGEPGLNGVAAEAADVDGDGDMDVLVSYFQQADRIYVNDGKGTFSVGQVFEGNAILGDVDGDGDPDAVCVPGGGVGPVSIWLNTKGRFVLQGRSYDVGEGIVSVAVTDLDGDGDSDLVVLGRTARTTLWENDGRRAFRKLDQALEPGTRMTAGDVDLDGDLDLVVGNILYLNSGGGRFENVQMFDLGDLPTALLLVDIDKDGDLDLLANRGNRQSGTTQLLLFVNTLPRARTTWEIAKPHVDGWVAEYAKQGRTTPARDAIAVRIRALLDEHRPDIWAYEAAALGFNNLEMNGEAVGVVRQYLARFPGDVTLRNRVVFFFGNWGTAADLDALPEGFRGDASYWHALFQARVRENAPPRLIEQAGLEILARVPASDDPGGNRRAEIAEAWLQHGVSPVAAEKIAREAVAIAEIGQRPGATLASGQKRSVLDRLLVVRVNRSTLGWALYHPGRYSEAATELRRATTLLAEQDVNARAVHYRLGRTLEKLGETKAAVDAFLKELAWGSERAETTAAPCGTCTSGAAATRPASTRWSAMR